MSIGGSLTTAGLLFVRGTTMKYPIVTSFGFSTKLHHLTMESSSIKILHHLLFALFNSYENKKGRESLIMPKLNFFKLNKDFVTIC